MEDLKSVGVIRIEILERKAAWLAFKGLKIFEIGQQLSLTSKSVEKLLGNARRKINAAILAERENA